MANAMYRAAAAPAEILSSQGGVAARIECSCCGSIDHWGLSKLPPPEIIHKHFTQKGWGLRKRPTCPDCQAKKRIKPVSVSPIKTTPVAANQPEPSDAAKKAKRLIYQALEDYYDDSKKAYRPGHSDETIAKEVGASAAFVKAVREADFGPLSAPADIKDLLDRIEVMTKQVKELSDRAEFMMASVQSLITRNGWAR